MPKTASLAIICALLFALGPARPSAAAPRIVVLTVAAEINPATANYLARGLHEAQSTGATLLLVKLDTPGGQMIAMQRMVSDILASPVPVGVWVAPPGARAASAGTFLAYAAHVAAMAPSTVIGAAHPVFLSPLPGTTPDTSPPPSGQPPSTMEEKVVNDAAAQIRGLAQLRGRNATWAEQAVRQSVSATADEAVRLGIVDFLAATPEEFAQKADGRQVKLAAGMTTLHTAGAIFVPLDMNWRESLLGALADPNLAYLLMVIGFWAIILEMKAPHFGGLGTLGIICMILALYGLSVLPFNWAGLILIVVGFGFMLTELYMPTHGALSLGGLVAFIIGSLLLVDAPTMTVSRPLIAGVAVATAAFFMFALAAIVRSQKRPAVIGQGALVGATGVVRERLDPTGFVYLDGALWRASSEGETLEPGAQVVVVAEAPHLTLKVRAASAKEK
jgi:membrane-bound serine protease (ClpP class)